jgi:hypothetical protein
VSAEDQEDAAAARRVAAQDFVALAAERRRLAIRGARIVRRLEQTGAHVYAGCSSIGHFAERNGMSASEAKELQNLARALEAEPDLEADVVAGTIPVASAAILGELAAAPWLVRPDDRWREAARTKSTRELRRMYYQRRDESRAGEPVISVTAYVTPLVRENLRRAQVLASRKAHHVLTMGQTLGIVTSAWLSYHDPLRQEPGTRRVPDTSNVPGTRYVPSAVDREVRNRSGDRCIVPFCDGIFWLDRSHRVAHAQGGSREAENLDLLCDDHHMLYEIGMITITGPAAAPVVTDLEGRVLDGRIPFGEMNRIPKPDVQRPPNEREGSTDPPCRDGGPAPPSAA